MIGKTNKRRRTDHALAWKRPTAGHDKRSDLDQVVQWSDRRGRRQNAHRLLANTKKPRLLAGLLADSYVRFGRRRFGVSPFGFAGVSFPLAMPFL